MLIANFVSLLKDTYYLNQLIEHLKPGVAGKGDRKLYSSTLYPGHQPSSVLVLGHCFNIYKYSNRALNLYHSEWK